MSVEDFRHDLCNASGVCCIDNTRVTTAQQTSYLCKLTPPFSQEHTDDPLKERSRDENGCTNDELEMADLLLRFLYDPSTEERGHPGAPANTPGLEHFLTPREQDNDACTVTLAPQNDLMSMDVQSTDLGSRKHKHIEQPSEGADFPKSAGPKRARFNTPEAGNEGFWENRYKSLDGFPAFSTPVPQHVTVQDLIRDYPNHLRGKYLDDLMQHHYSPADLWNELPETTKDLWVKGGHIKRRSHNMFTKRLQWRRRNTLGDQGMIDLFVELETKGPRRQSSQRHYSLTTREFHQCAKRKLATDACA